MHYEINVSENGFHLFATAPRSLTTQTAATELAARLADAFPAATISVTRRETIGHAVFTITPDHAGHLAAGGR